jgi:hypothetical protein
VPKTAPSISALPSINVYGGTVNIAQTGSGDISQQNAPQHDLAEVRGLLAELEAAIRDVQAPDDEVEGFLEPVEQLNSELGKPRPLISRLTRGWGAIQAIAAELGPKAHDLIQALARASSG